MEKGGWSIFHTWFTGGFILNPVVTTPFRGLGTAGWFGWYANPKVEELTQAWVDAKDADERKKVAAAIQLENYTQVPTVNLGKANVSDNGRADAARYVLDTQQLEDENTGINPQPVQVRLLNLRLMLSNQDTSGYDVLPIAHVEKSPKAEAVPQLADRRAQHRPLERVGEERRHGRRRTRSRTVRTAENAATRTIRITATAVNGSNGVK